MRVHVWAAVAKNHSTLAASNGFKTALL